MEHFFVKLIAPRSTFAQDMTEDERKIMEEHAAYWKDMQEKGFALVYGPVMDPNGAWGMGVVEASDEAEAKALSVNDPVSKANLLRYEIYPMRAHVMQKNNSAAG